MQNIRQPIPLTPGYRLQNWYEIGRVLGRGNIGVTYQAHDCNLERTVAIKEYLPVSLAARESGVFVQPSDTHDEDSYHIGVEAFLDEARVLAKLDHPNVPSIINVFVAHNTAYMVMSFEEGETLESILQRRRTLEEGELLHLLMPLLSALERLHDIGHIHGDLTPTHIMVRPDGSPVMLDFGGTRRMVSELTHSLHASPGFSAPEIYFGKKDQIGPAADIYGLAAVLYRAVTGVTPPDALERSRSMLSESRDPLMPCLQMGGQRYSESLLRTIDSGLRLDRDERPKTIAAWRREFGSSPIGGMESVRLRADSDPGFAAAGRRPRRSRSEEEGSRTLLVAGGLLAVVLLLLAGRALLNREDEAPSVESAAQKPPAEAAAIPSLPPVAAAAATPAPSSDIRKEPERTTASPSPRAAQDDLLADKVLALLSAARDDMDAGRQLSPADDNALAKFRAVLALNPGHAEAREGLNRIANELIAKAQEASRRRDWSKAQGYLDQAGSVLPGLDKLAAARKELHAHMLESSPVQPQESPKPTGAAAQAQHLASVARRAIARKQWQKAGADINKIAAFMPQYEELPALRQELADALQRQPAEVPPPPSGELSRGAKRELQTYIKRARTALQRHHWDKANYYIGKAAALTPDSEEVSALQGELNAALREAPAPVEPVAVPPPQNAPTAAAQVAIRGASVSLPVASPGQTIEFETDFVLELPQGERERQVTATWSLIHNGRRIGKQGEASMPLKSGSHSTRTELELPASMKAGTYVVEHRIGAGNSQDVARSSFQVTHP
ncbi:serine/threonine protein kinase [Methyloterricola oryzae]|uniref:serine/threonine protein kinase n=1 Tax=Methyloterricola oryzae TaxID=1495050 RepID=UPI0005EAEC1F|nr:serine/threonine-protein kinase [Methyloterricola oryzae]